MKDHVMNSLGMYRQQNHNVYEDYIISVILIKNYFGGEFERLILPINFGSWFQSKDQFE